MNRASGSFFARVSSTAVNEGDGSSEEEERKPRNRGWHGYRGISSVATSAQSLAADRHFSCGSRKTVGNWQCVSSSAAVLHTAKAESTSSPSVAADQHPSCHSSEEAGSRQGVSSSVTVLHAPAVPHAEEVKSILASPVQQPAGIATGARPKQRRQPEAWAIASQAAFALVFPDAGKVFDIKKAACSPVLPQQLSEKGYQLTDNAKLLARGSVQSVYSLIKKTANGSEASEFVVKFPAWLGQCLALQGLAIQERLAGSHHGDQYFVPVVEKIVERDQLICHVEPRGMSVVQYVKDNGLDLKQKTHIIARTLEAVGEMHAQGVANLDIKAGNLIIKNPVADMQVRFCDFDFAVEFGDINREMPVAIGTYEFMCPEVLEQVPYLPVMADLWAFTCTAWSIMTFKKPVLHWLSGILKTQERRSRVLPELMKCLFQPGQGHAFEGKLFPDDKNEISDEQLLKCLRKERDEDRRQQLQLFFWKHLDFPGDIDRLQISPVERCMLKEMLSIMFFPSSYSDKLKKMMSLTTAVASCDELLAAGFELDDSEVLQRLIQVADYRPCERAGSLTGAMQPCLSDYLSDRSGRQMPAALVRLPGQLSTEESAVLSSAAACGYGKSGSPDSDDLSIALPDVCEGLPSPHSGNERYWPIGDSMVWREQHLPLRFPVSIASQGDYVRGEIIDDIVEGESPDSPEEKSDNPRLLWWAREWEECRDPQGISRCLEELLIKAGVNRL